MEKTKKNKKLYLFRKDHPWLYAVMIRAVKTMAQTAVATIGSAALLSEVNIGVVVSASVLAGMLSVLTSLAGIPEAER